MARAGGAAGQHHEAQERAYELFLRHWSFRDIAQEVLPDTKGGHVTVFRWAKNGDWKGQRDQLEAAQRQQQHDQFLDTLEQIRERHLRIARKAEMAAELVLDSYFVEVDGQMQIRTNDKGYPIIGAMALTQLLNAATELTRKTVGFDQVTVDDAEQLAARQETRIVEADPERAEKIRLIAERLALETLTTEQPHGA